MKKIILLIFAVCLCLPSWASRARSSVISMKQPDGSTIQVRLHGDENYNYYTTPEGLPLLRLDNGWFELSTWEAVHQQAWSAATTGLHRGKVIDDYPSENTTPVFLPHTGEPRVCVILMEFPDKPFTYSKEEIDIWLNGEQTQFVSSTKSTGSVAEYFNFCSQGKFRPQFDVFGPYPTDSLSAWYGYNQGLSVSAKRLVTNALTAADADVDYSLFDNYGEDGYLDLVYVIFSGQGANESGDLDQPWSLSGTHYNLGSYDGVQACRYGISNEIIIGNNVVYQDGIGVFCHELSHTMGLPDLYDTSGALSNWDNNGPEAWDLMDDGENVVNGMWPMPYVAWERELFGWIEMEQLTGPLDVTLYPLNDPEGRGKAYYVVNPANPDEYYTFENIPETEWYGWITRYHAQGGMLMTHVNYVRSLFASNRVNTTEDFPNLTIVPADGYLLSSYSIGEERVIDGETVTVDRTFYRSHLGGDPYPGAKEVSSVSAYQNYAGQDMAESFPITEIVRSEDGSVSFKFMGGTDAAIADVLQDKAAEPVIFDMSGHCLGRKIDRLPQGLYIVDGRKVVR